MTKTTTQTAAEKYRAILASRRPTYTITSPTGMEWTLRQVTPQDYFLANQLPFQIAQKLSQKMEIGQSEGEALSELSKSDQLEWLLFLQKLVKDALVSPRLVEFAQAEDEIDFILQEDFEFLIAQVMGGEAAKVAGNFRGETGANALDSIDGKKRRRKT